MVNIRMAHGDSQIAHHFMIVIRCDNLMGPWCLAWPSM